MQKTIQPTKTNTKPQSATPAKRPAKKPATAPQFTQEDKGFDSEVQKLVCQHFDVSSRAQFKKIWWRDRHVVYRTENREGLGLIAKARRVTKQTENDVVAREKL